MRLVLEITSGPDAGRRAWLREGQVLEVGRTDLATFTVPHDSRMSGRHFAVRLDRQGCQLQDLGSRNGTLVNNNRVSETVLRDRDVIVAGETRFVVQLQGADAMASPASSRATPRPPRRLFLPLVQRFPLLQCQPRWRQVASADGSAEPLRRTG